MRQIWPLLFLLPLLLSACASVPGRLPSSEERLPWKRFGGIELATVRDQLTVLRADPLANPLELVTRPETGGLSVEEVAARNGFLAATNAAMFASDYSTSIGYMRNFRRINNSRISSRLRGFLLFHPRRPGLQPVKVGGREDLDGYDTAFQSYRMWSESEGILWKQGASFFQQVSLVGVDSRSRVLFFHHPGFTDVHDLVAGILELGLDLKGLLYLDGGHHGALFLSPGLGTSSNAEVRIPNVLGLRASRNRGRP